jgi:hypothetical protein
LWQRRMSWIAWTDASIWRGIGGSLGASGDRRCIAGVMDSSQVGRVGSGRVLWQGRRVIVSVDPGS